MKFPYKKILIIGCSGAGKSTLAVLMGKKFNLPVVHLDRLWWLPNWVERSREDFDLLLDKELAKSKWIIDGNFSRTFERRLQCADFCIYLDYPTQLCVDSAKKRAEIFCGRSRPDMTEGCNEKFDEEFESWITGFNEKTKPVMLEILNKSAVPYQIFRSREETADWLASFNGCS